MPRGRYTTVKIPEELAKTLDGIGDSWGFRSRAEMVDEAIRMYILRMKELNQQRLPAPQTTSPTI
ncbi:MAG: ribbon-helix-helix protein, CopG family [Thaumarchaeota archaeon]|nr:ribbon-helix-helix protein, CopG family [Nitrososphaerota archaeon]